jgi:putative ABC transport system ATP-binding protein
VEARHAHFRILLRQIIGLLTLQAVASAALLTIGGALVLQGELTLGQLVASELIVGAIVASVAKFGKHLESWYDVMAAVDKLGFLVDLTTESEGGEAPRERRGPAAVELRRVRFGYEPMPALFEDFELRVEPGARVAVLGPAGAGASTLLDLLYALKRPEQGMVQVDGLDLRYWNLAELRRDVALVRGAEIVEGSIADNVRLGRDHLTLDDVRRTLESVGLMDTVLQLRDGMDTMLKPGGAPLSTSQRTRLVLARAIIGRPRLLLLDEALDGLGSSEIAELQAFLFAPQQPWTLILVTQTEELVAGCDQVVRLPGIPRRPRRAGAGPVVES